VLKHISDVKKFGSLWFLYGLLLFLSIHFFASSIGWIIGQLIQPEHRFSQISLLILLVVFIYHLSNFKHSSQWQLNSYSPAVFAFIIASSLFLLNEKTLEINIFSATFTLLAYYSLLGLFIESLAWRRGSIIALLIILLLPFGDYFDVFFGFPLRLFTAQASSDLLLALGYTPQSIETFIALDNQLLFVDISCSGIHGLWSGMIFFILLTCLEHKKITPIWMLTLVLFLLLIIVMNVFRISIMVLLEVVLQQFQFATLVHNSMGIIGFSIACMMGWLLLLGLKTDKQGNRQVVNKISQSEPNRLLLGLLIVILVVFNFFLISHDNQSKNQFDTQNKRDHGTENSTLVSPYFPKWWSYKIISLNQQEKDFFPRQGAYAQKFQFNWQQKLSGSVVFVNTYYWKAHHDPINCFQAQAYTLLSDNVISIANVARGSKKEVEPFMIHQLHLVKGNKKYHAYYWFQSERQQTADFSQRLFADIVDSLRGNKQMWTMVSLLIQETNENSYNEEKQLLVELASISNVMQTKVRKTNEK